MSILDKSGLLYFYTKLKGKFAPLSHTHDDRYYTESEINTKISTLNTAISGKAASSHTHDDRYYTESEIDTKVSTLNTAISGKAASSHTHTKSQITDFPTSMPASDVYAWAKASAKPSYTYSEVGAAAASHSHSEYASSSHHHFTVTSSYSGSWINSGTEYKIVLPACTLGKIQICDFTVSTGWDEDYDFYVYLPSGGKYVVFGASGLWETSVKYLSGGAEYGHGTFDAGDSSEHITVVYARVS